jgi:hypothetical protein
MRERKCIRQFVLIAERNVKCHSSLRVADLFTVESVTRREHLPEEVDFR